MSQYWTNPKRKGHHSKVKLEIHRLHLPADPDGRWAERTSGKYYERDLALRDKTAWLVNWPCNGAYGAMTDAVELTTEPY